MDNGKVILKMPKYYSYTLLKLGIKYPELKISPETLISWCDMLGIHSFLYNLHEPPQKIGVPKSRLEFNQARYIFTVVLAYTFYVSCYVGLN